MNQDQGNDVAKVYLVGTGPGGPRLMTLRGVECLGRGDLILYDCLVNPLILSHAPPPAEAVYLGQGGPRRSHPKTSHAQIVARMFQAARQVRKAVYLKSGGSPVSMRTAEETEALAAAGTACEIVRGVTATLAAVLSARRIDWGTVTGSALARWWPCSASNYAQASWPASARSPPRRSAGWDISQRPKPRNIPPPAW